MALHSIIEQPFQVRKPVSWRQLIRTLAAALLLLTLTAPSQARCMTFLPALAAQRQTVSGEATLQDSEVPKQRTPRRDLDQILRNMREKAVAEVASALSKVKSPDLQTVARALEAEIHRTSDGLADTPANTLEELVDLDGDSVPELIFKWSRAKGFSLEDPELAGLLPDWTLFLLSWKGVEWRASMLMEGDGLYELHVLPKLGSGKAVAVVEGITLVPFPVIFQFKDHAATLLWDARAAESLYQGFAGGEVEFHELEGVADPVMVVSGKADPGFLFFRRDRQRGFVATTVYAWDGKAYVPRHTEYTPNEDYVLYRFISALHLRDFRSAYALTDPARFLNTDQPSLELFQKYVEDSLPEFLGNNIFEARDTGEDEADDYSFRVTAGNKRYVYRPRFTGDSRYLLTGLERKEE